MESDISLNLRQEELSTSILYKLDQITLKTIKASVASKWINELEDSVQLTKNQIHQRVNEDISAFEAQLALAQSVQTRRHSLYATVSSLCGTPNDLLFNLQPKLKEHALLEQEALDSKIAYEALNYVSEYELLLKRVEDHVQTGGLPEATAACLIAEKLLETAPTALVKSEKMSDMKTRLISIRSKTNELIEDAYKRSIEITANKIVILSEVLVRGTSHSIALRDILKSLSESPQLYSMRMTELKHKITELWINHCLQQSASISQSQQPPALEQFPAPPIPVITIQSKLTTIVHIWTYLDAHLFPHVPAALNPQQHWVDRFKVTFQQSILQNLILPSLPSSVSGLPGFLDCVRSAIDFESKTLNIGQRIGEIYSWAKNVRAYYERARRTKILADARFIMMAQDDDGTFLVDASADTQATLMQGVPKVLLSPPLSQNLDASSSGNGASWGFEDDDEDTKSLEVTKQSSTNTIATKIPPIDSDAWGWEEDNEFEEDAPLEVDDDEEDPWADPKPSTKPLRAEAPLEISENNAATQTLTKTESYLVSSKTRHILELIVQTLSEASAVSDFSFRSVVDPQDEEEKQPGSILASTAITIADLFRALYPLSIGQTLAHNQRDMRFSADCWWLKQQLMEIQDTAAMRRTQEKLTSVFESSYEGSIDAQQQSIFSLLDGANGFVGLAEQRNFEHCETIVSDVLKLMRSNATSWKPILPASKYYFALGSTVNGALSRIMNDILYLEDIPEVESHRLSLLCKALSSLEDLFAENAGQTSSVVSFVSSWLKFSYLSELLEASMADLVYLFQEGALVDFKVEELVKLVKALFADTPLRRTTIEKLLSGHPAPKSTV